MVNFNGEFFSKDTSFLKYDNRAAKYGDALFETIRVVNGTVFFWEDHYFRLMASMRILRMEIPMNFTLEFLEDQIVKTSKENGFESASRIRLTVFRKGGGLYAPTTNDISYTIEAIALDSPFYVMKDEIYEVALFKDYFLNKDMLSNLKTTNKILNVVASVFAAENKYHNCFLINSDKQVVEMINGNLFLVKGKTIKTPPLSDGCLDGITRKKLIEIVDATEEFQFMEASISPFELQKADELFITNSINGIIPIGKYRKKEYGKIVAKGLLGKLNAKARMESLS
ncbi:MAG: aminotransferase class IV [Flavobacteriaceae bacterium]